MIVATKGPKNTKVGDVIEAGGSLWVVDAVDAKEVRGMRLVNGELKHLRTFRARQVKGVWRAIGKHTGRA